ASFTDPNKDKTDKKETHPSYQTLPQKDCGLCGAPSCRAFCEDLVDGRIPKDSVCPQLNKG
ncbi:MAG: hypothetical protein IJO25_05270, partial [Clostridia bacterium]|nr:hypothetical protein [Clostridia bacterium]